MKTDPWQSFLDLASHRVFLATPLVMAAIVLLFWLFGDQEVKRVIEFLTK
jgi:hypothetical protein